MFLIADHTSYLCCPRLTEAEQRQAEGVSISEGVLGMDPLLNSPFNTHLLSAASTVPHQLSGASHSTRLMGLLGGLKIQHRKVLKSVSGSLEELPPLQCP